MRLRFGYAIKDRLRCEPPLPSIGSVLTSPRKERTMRKNLVHVQQSIPEWSLPFSDLWKSELLEARNVRLQASGE